MGEMIRNWLRDWLGITAIEQKMAEDTAAIRKFSDAVTASALKSLTQPTPKAQDGHKAPLSGSRLRILSERLNATVPEPTQAERLENHG